MVFDTGTDAYISVIITASQKNGWMKLYEIMRGKRSLFVRSCHCQYFGSGASCCPWTGIGRGGAGITQMFF